MEASTSQAPNPSIDPAEAAPARARLVPGRECGSCTLCCKVVGVVEISKPGGTWCPHCAGGKRCAIYEQRYASCRDFYCQWMVEKSLGPEWKPERAKFVLIKTEGGRHLSACVDPGHSSAWRRSPYYETFKHWAQLGLRMSPNLYLVDVRIGGRCIVILPERDVDIGVLGEDEMVRIDFRETTAGIVHDVGKVKRPTP